MEGTEMKQRVRHLLSVLLVCAMVLSLLPISVLAEELETPLTTVTEPTEVPEVESDTEEDPEPAIEPEEEITPNPAQTIYVSSEGNDVNDGSKEPLNNRLCPVPTQCISRYLHLVKVI